MGRWFYAMVVAALLAAPQASAQGCVDCDLVVDPWEDRAAAPLSSSEIVDPWASVEPRPYDVLWEIVDPWRQAPADMPTGRFPLVE